MVCLCCEIVQADSIESGESSLRFKRTKEYFRGKRRALLIGVNKYQDSTIKPLNYAVLDSKKVEKVFQLVGHFSKGDIQLLNDETKIKPTMKDIESKLLEMSKPFKGKDGKLEEVDTLVVYFSGHGFRKKGKDGKEEDYIVPTDAKHVIVKEGKKKVYDYKNVISINKLKDSLKAKRIIFLVDACRTKFIPAEVTKETEKNEVTNKINPKLDSSQTKEDIVKQYFQEQGWIGLKPHSIVEEELSEEILDSKGVTILFGTATENESNEDTTMKGGVFTYYLCKGLMGEIQDSAGPEYISFRSLDSYLDKQFKKYENRTGLAQALYKNTDFKGDLLITYGRPQGKERVERYNYPNKSENNVYGKWIIDISQKEERRKKLITYTIDEVGQYIPKELDGVSQIEYEYDTNPYYYLAKEFNVEGKNTYNYKIEELENGKIEIRLSEEGSLTKKIYEKGNIILEQKFGADGKSKEDRDGFARYEYKYDEKGNKILEQYFGEDGKPKSNFYGIAKYEYKYDEKGNKILEQNFGADGKPREDKDDGIARYEYKYNEKGNKILAQNFGADGKSKEDRYGIARYEYKYDENCLNAGNKPEYCYTLEQYFGADGKHTGDHLGIARYEYKYDEKGNKILAQNFGADGKPKEGKFAATRKEYKYDEKGNKILEQNFDVDGKPKEDRDGIAKYEYKYDEKGNKILEQNFDVDGKPKEDRDGIAKYEYKYDENCLKAGNKPEYCYNLKQRFGADGKPTGGNYNGIARYEYKYDENCLKAGNKPEYCYTLKQCFGVDDKPSEDHLGIARYEYKYDEKGNRILIQIFGADGKPSEDRGGFARYEYKYDEKGNKILIQIFGADGKPSEDRNGFARYEYKYDENCLKTGNKSEYCYILEQNFGTDGKPKEDHLGIARYEYKYDEKGNKILKQYFGAEGKLKEIDGIAREEILCFKHSIKIDRQDYFTIKFDYLYRPIKAKFSSIDLNKK
jgi:uncharacterized caspase-like protein